MSLHVPLRILSSECYPLSGGISPASSTSSHTTHVSLSSQALPFTSIMVDVATFIMWGAMGFLECCSMQWSEASDSIIPHHSPPIDIIQPKLLKNIEKFIQGIE